VCRSPIAISLAQFPYLGKLTSALPIYKSYFLQSQSADTFLQSQHEVDPFPGLEICVKCSDAKSALDSAHVLH
jgi:hypothetical protein